METNDSTSCHLSNLCDSGRIFLLNRVKKEEEKVKLNPQYSVLIKSKKYDKDQYNYLNI